MIKLSYCIHKIKIFYEMHRFKYMMDKLFEFKIKKLVVIVYKYKDFIKIKIL